MIVFERKHWQVIIGVFSALFILGVLFYLLLVRPTDERIELLKTQSLKTEVSEPVNEEPVSISENEFALLTQKVPINREEEAIILDLEKSALASDTLLDSIVFQYDGLINEQFTEVENEDGSPSETDTELDNSSDERVQQTELVPAPPDLKTIVVELEIQSKDYESMLLFLEEMEKLNRIYTIETFAFTGFSEGEERVGPMEDLFNYSIQLVTYYAPDINLPIKIDTPVSSEEAEKINPLHDVTEVKETISSIDGSSNSSNEPIVSDITEQEVVLEPPSEQPVAPQQPAEKSHIVKNGETLFSISMDYYGNRNGETIIMKANNKKVNTVYVGEVLRIPSY